jgi:hypothetical protein
MRSSAQSHEHIPVTHRAGLHSYQHLVIYNHIVAELGVLAAGNSVVGSLLRVLGLPEQAGLLHGLQCAGDPLWRLPPVPCHHWRDRHRLHCKFTCPFSAIDMALHACVHSACLLLALGHLFPERCNCFRPVHDTLQPTPQRALIPGSPNYCFAWSKKSGHCLVIEMAGPRRARNLAACRCSSSADGLAF